MRNRHQLTILSPAPARCPAPGGARPALTRHGAGRRRRLAAGFLAFVLMAIPAVMLSAAMSVDMGRILIAHREATNLADAAATAGALQYCDPVVDKCPSSAVLYAPAAVSAADQTWAVGCYGTTSGTGTCNVASAAGLVANPSVTFNVSGLNGGPGDQEVTVTVTYSVTNLIFLGWFISGSSNAHFTATASAQLCNSTQGTYCARPRN